MRTHQFRFCLNTSTIAGQALDVVDQISLAGHSGYDGIEIWMRSLHDHLERGGTLAQVAAAADAADVVIENAIGFVPWAVDDNALREKGLTEAIRDLEILEAVGCRRMAAPPFGAVDAPAEIAQLGNRFDVLVDLCAGFHVTPQLELWGFSATLGNLGELRHVAAAATTQPVKLLLDAYHLHRGGSALEDIGLIDRQSIDIFHLNDFPVERPIDELTDADRVYPGEGGGPVREIIELLAAKGTPIALSIELFNRALWELPAAQVAVTALDKMRSTVDLSLA